MSARAKEPPSLSPGYVYLLKAGIYYKIGRAKDVTRRLAQIEPQLPFKVELVCIVATDDAHGLEADLHNMYAERHTNGEWFELGPEDVAYIKELVE